MKWRAERAYRATKSTNGFCDMPRVLILAYGNPLRSDDGVAWRAADMLERQFPRVAILRLHQLTPELADAIRDYDCVIFIDAACDEGLDREPGTVRVEEIRGKAAGPSRFSHTLSPQRVLNLAEQLYAAHPRAFVVMVTGASFDHGSALSPPVANALPVLISWIERLLSELEPMA